MHQVHLRDTYLNTTRPAVPEILLQRERTKTDVISNKGLIKRIKWDNNFYLLLRVMYHFTYNYNMKIDHEVSCKLHIM